MGNKPFTKAEIEEIVTIVRLALYNHGQSCGPEAIRKEMKDSDVKPIPSERTIARILAKQGLTHRRTGLYPGECLNL